PPHALDDDAAKRPVQPELHAAPTTAGAQVAGENPGGEQRGAAPEPALQVEALLLAARGEPGRRVVEVDVGALRPQLGGQLSERDPRLDAPGPPELEPAADRASAVAARGLGPQRGRGPGP